MSVPPRLVELIDWLTETIEPLEGRKWQITLNSDGYVVEATAKIVTSERARPNQSMTITKVTEAKFRIGKQAKRTVFSTD